MTIGNRVLSTLDEKGLKQKDLALFLGTKPSTINGWSKENRNPSSDSIARICEFLGVSFEYLLTGVDTSHTVSAEDEEWLSLIHRLPLKARQSFKDKIEGYLIRMEEESVAAEETPLKEAK